MLAEKMMRRGRCCLLAMILLASCRDGAMVPDRSAIGSRVSVGVVDGLQRGEWIGIAFHPTSSTIEAELGPGVELCPADSRGVLASLSESLGNSMPAFESCIGDERDAVGASVVGTDGMTHVGVALRADQAATDAVGAVTFEPADGHLAVSIPPQSTEGKGAVVRIRSNSDEILRITGGDTGIIRVEQPSEGATRAVQPGESTALDLALGDVMLSFDGERPERVLVPLAIEAGGLNEE